jgi:hypothetical protein
MARNKLTMPDAYLSEDLAEEQLLELKGMVLGYAQADETGWGFYRSPIFTVCIEKLH